MSRLTINEAWLARLFLIAVVTVGAVTWAQQIPPSNIQLVPCPVNAAAGIECPGCGMTRACTSVVQGKWYEAVTYHPLVFALLGFAMLFALAPRACQSTWRQIPRVGRAGVWTIAYLTVFVIWISRLV